MDYRQLKQQMKSQNERFADLIEKCRAGSDNEPTEIIEKLTDKDIKDENFLKTLKTGGLKLIFELVKLGANVNAMTITGETALHVAVDTPFIKDAYKIAKFLIAQGAKVNAENYWYSTPLHNAVMSGDPKLVKLLLDSGAKTVVNKQTREKWTPNDYAKLFSMEKNKKKYSGSEYANRVKIKDMLAKFSKKYTDHASLRENIEHRLEESFAALVERYKSGSDYEPTE